MQIISQGAEAVIYRDQNLVVKKRVPKSYRLKELDDSIRGFRTRREAKVMQKLSKIGVNCPALQNCDEKEQIVMQFIDGQKVKDCATNEVMKEVGRKIGLIHKQDIIHSDLTTSNMIFSYGNIYMIDFGLSYFSAKEEDKAVDLQVFYRALQSTHSEFKEFFDSAIFGYKETYSDAEKVLKRLEIVEKRGRNKK